MFEIVALLFPILSFIITAVVAYFVVRFGVGHGIKDANKKKHESNDVP